MVGADDRYRGEVRRRREIRHVVRSFTLGPARIAIGTGDASFGRIRVQNGRIADILPADGPTDVPLPSGTTISPGMIDVHTNGARDALFNREQGSAVDVAARTYAGAGATGFVATIMTAPWESMLHAAREVAEAAHERAERPVTGARCLGIHFEGPFLNNKFRRVHRHDWLLSADRERAHALVEACRGALVMVTMAPEVEGVDDCARFFFDQGVVCSAGHTSAKYGDGMLAIALGFRSLTHAFNAMPPLDHREPSLLAAFIQETRTSVQVICDGHHVAPVMIDILYRAVGERLVLATDYMAPAGEGYRIEGGVVRAEDGTIAGAALQVDEALRNLMSYASLPFERAIVNATAAPARLLGIEAECGTLERGKRADLTLWDERYGIVATLVGGEPVYGSPHFAGAPDGSDHLFGNAARAASF